MNYAYSPPILDPVQGPGDEFLFVQDDRFYFRSEIRSEENALPDGDYPGRYQISGRGVKSNDSCGVPKGRYRLEGTNQVKSAFYGCHRQGCPVCFRTWAIRTADKATAFLEAVSQRNGAFWNHATWAPSDAWVAEHMDDWKLMEYQLAEFLKKWHVGNVPLGYTLVRHPRTIKCEVCGYTCETHRLPKACPQCDALNPWKWFFKPHLHLITNFWFNKGDSETIAEKLDETGAVFVNINVKAEIPPLRGDQLKKVIAYELGHALWKHAVGRGHGMKSIRYFGCLAKGKYKRFDHETNEDIVEDDGSRWYKLRVTEGYDLDGNITGEYSVENSFPHWGGPENPKYLQKRVCSCVLFAKNEILPPYYQELLYQRKMTKERNQDWPKDLTDPCEPLGRHSTLLEYQSRFDLDESETNKLDDLINAVPPALSWKQIVELEKREKSDAKKLAERVAAGEVLNWWEM